MGHGLTQNLARAPQPDRFLDVVERLPAVLHHEHVSMLRIAQNRVNLADVRMVDRVRLHELVEERLVLSFVRLLRDEQTARVAVSHFERGTEAAGPELAHDLVVTFEDGLDVTRWRGWNRGSGTGGGRRSGALPSQRLPEQFVDIRITVRSIDQCARICVIQQPPEMPRILSDGADGEISEIRNQLPEPNTPRGHGRKKIGSEVRVRTARWAAELLRRELVPR